MGKRIEDLTRAGGDPISLNHRASHAYSDQFDGNAAAALTVLIAEVTTAPFGALYAL
jgi:hypothetical protein